MRSAITVFFVTVLISGIAWGQRSEWGLDTTGCVGPTCTNVSVACSQTALEAELADPVDKHIRFSGGLCTIDLDSKLNVVDGENLTIDCQDKTTFTGFGLRLNGWNNVIVKGCRFRAMRGGDDWGGDTGDCVTATVAPPCSDCKHQDLQISGNSCLYATDEGIDIQAPADDVAVFDNEIGAGLYHSEHSTATGHSYCMRIGAIGGNTTDAADQILVYKNDFIGCKHRVPQIVQKSKVYVRGNRVYLYGDPAWSNNWYGSKCKASGATTRIRAEDNKFYPGPDNEPWDASERPYSIEELPGGDCKLYLAGNEMYPLDNDLPVTNQIALMDSGVNESVPPFNDHPTTGLPSTGLRRGPDANADVDDQLVRGWFDCYLQHWDETRVLEQQNQPCSFGTVGFRSMTQDDVPFE